ncbi:MAG: type II toxin-antitoxin system PemK/MazF family toxin [Gemmatimonadales bacterium]
MVIPDRGDVVLISFEGARGGEVTRRPALVVSPARYNSRSGLALMCPIAQRAKGYPFEVALPKGAPVSGVVLADHLRSTDWRARGAELVGQAPPSVVSDVLAKLKPI